MSECLQAQLDEVHALHYIFFPATVSCRAGVPDYLFAEDLMPSDEYQKLLSVMRPRTKIRLYAESSTFDDSREDLLKIGFRASPYSGDYYKSTDMAQSFIDVTFPTEYPETPPCMVITMNMSLSNTSQIKLVSQMKKVIRDTKDGVCIYNAVMCLNDFLHNVHAKHYQLWDETTGEAVYVDHGEVYTEHSAAITKGSSADNTDSERGVGMMCLAYSDMVSTSAQSGELALSFESINSLIDRNITFAPNVNDASPVEKDAYSSGLEVCQWSVHSAIQSPLWYETNKKTMKIMREEVANENVEYFGGQKKVVEGFWQNNKSTNLFGSYVLLNSSHSPAYRGVEQTMEIQNKSLGDSYSSSSAMASIGSDVPPPRSDREVSYPLSPQTVVRINRSLTVLKALASTNTMERYWHDFKETTTMTDTSYSSFVKAHHMLDKNCYMVRKYALPSFCPLNVKKKMFDPKEDVNRFLMVRKVIIQKIISRIAVLASLQHNSIARYYQCWSDKSHSKEVISNMVNIAETLLDNGSIALDNGENKLMNSLKNKMKCLLLDKKYTDKDLTEFALNEEVTTRKLYIQITNYDGMSLEEVIKKEELYKDETRIWILIRHLLDVLAYLHSNNAYHQDLSPNNIIFYNDASGTVVKVCFFGITRLLRQLCYSGFFCGNTQCSCHEYYSEMRKELYSCHPSTYSFGPEIDFSNLQELQNVSDYEAQQEDMFAFGILIFRMWHPPVEERAMKDILTSVICKKQFPQYFIRSTPPIIVSTLIRLFSSEKRPTAMELLSETLVPPVMDRELYKHYLRRLQNPSSEEVLDALDFLFKRQWKEDVTKLRSNIPLSDLAFISGIVEGLETFMRQRSVIITKPLVLQPKTFSEEGDDYVLALNENNTVLYLTKSILNAMKKSYTETEKNKHIISLKRFCVGECFEGETCKLSGVYGSSQKLDTHLLKKGLSRHILKQLHNSNEILSNLEMRIVDMEAGALCTAFDSLVAVNIGEKVSLVLHYPLVVIDFIALSFNISIEAAHETYKNISSLDINHYTLTMHLQELGIAEDDNKEILIRVADLLRKRCKLSHALYEMHSIVMSTTYSSCSPWSEVLDSISQEIATFCNQKPIVFPSSMADLCNPQHEQYIKKVKHMLELAKALSALDHAEDCYMECIPESKVEELYDCSIDLPSFSCYAGSDKYEKLVLVGGSVIDEFRVLHVYFEYFFQNMVELNEYNKMNGDAEETLLTDGIDVVVTCQNSKLLPAACSISSRLIDAGMSCECRALPLIYTNHFNERLRKICGVKVRVHLQNRQGTSSDQDPTVTISEINNIDRLSDEEASAVRDSEVHNTEQKHGQMRYSGKGDLGATRKHDRSTFLTDTEYQLDGDSHSRRGALSNAVEYEDDRLFTNVSFHVESLRGVHIQPRKIDNGASLVRYVKSLLSSES